MNYKLHFLGTGCMLPTKERNPLSVALEHNGEIFLFDCAEGTQRQIKTMKLPIGKIKKIFISHWHGDHTLGLPGLLQTLSNTDNIEKVEVHGPKDTKKFMKHVLNSSIFDSKIEIKVIEHDPKKNQVLNIIDNANYSLDCVKLNHSVPCIGYSYKQKDTYNVDLKKLKKVAPELEKSPLLARAKMGLPIEYKGKKIMPDEITYKKEGIKISLVFDTRPCNEINLLVENSDYLVMEATFIYEKHQAKAEEHDHMSAKETAEIAQENNVKNLIITHFSQRYKDVKDIEAEAKEYFENTTSTQDLMTIKLRKD